MLRYRILHVGRKARDPLLQAAADYGDRLNHFAPCELTLVKESDRSGEARTLAGRLDSGELTVVLDETGESLTTAALAAQIQSWQQQGRRRITFVIGGADGLDPTIKQRGDRLLALSPMTLPHRLALVVLLEQLYRAHNILRGTPYHRAGG